MLPTNRLRAAARGFVVAVVLAALATLAVAQVNPNEYAGLVWRNIGPFRAGRVSSVSGAMGQPGVFYVGTPEGGVWKTDSAGMTWFPVFDSVPDVSSIGAVAVAPSDPNIIYAGTGDLVGEGAIDEGNGMYKSTDAGKTWRHIGLVNSKQIPAILVDPHDPNLVLVAAQGDLHHPNEERGVFRSTDGGATWKKVLYKGDTIGAQDVEWDINNPKLVFATTILHQVASNAAPATRGLPITGAAGDTAIYKSTDEGATWTQVQGAGLPNLNGRTSIAVAPDTNGQRIFLIGSFGLYRSDDQGGSWSKAITDYRIVGSNYICGVFVDPKNPDVVYVMNTSVYKSTDGGKTFIPWKGAPGGDDYHSIWIDPTDHNRMLLDSDEGATISYDGGATWSSWYNQATSQTYHIGVDNRFPYWVYGTQQDPCAFGTASRGDYGEVGIFDWSPIPIYESGYIVADPLDPNIVYGGGPDSGILKTWLNNKQWENVGPNIGAARGQIGTDYRKSAEQPLVFSPQDPHTLYLGTQYVTATSDGGMHWRNLGNKDLASRAPAPGEAAAAAPAAGRGGAAAGRGGLSTIAPSTVAAGEIWTGSNNGLIYVTRDGGNTWNNVTPPEVPANANVVIMDASHTDPAEAYATVDIHAAGDYTPYIYRTRDFGAHWTLITNGLPTNQPAGSFVRVVREDTRKKGLLFAGTESSVYVSFDDGDHWQSLALNLPVTSYRDLLVHGDDLVVGTFGRSFWVLDDISPLRQITPQTASQSAYLFKPADAVRVRKDLNRNTPLPPEIPHGLNPPTGAIFYYYLGSRPSGDIKLQIYDSQNNLVRTLSSAPIPPVPGNPPPNVPDYWLEQPQPMSTAVGTNRINWDLHYEHPPSFVQNYSLEKFDAVYHDTEWDPQGPLVVPGTYTAKLTVDGATSTQTFKITNDPRVPTTQATQADLVSMHDLQMKAYNGMFESWNGYEAVHALRERIKQLSAGQASAPVASALTALDVKLAPLEGTPSIAGINNGVAPAAGAGRGGGAAASTGGFGHINIQMGGDGQSGYVNVFGYAADIAPTASERRAYQISCTYLNEAVATWKTINANDVPALNTMLAGNQMQPLPIATALPTLACGPPVSIGPAGAGVAGASPKTATGAGGKPRN